MKSTFVSFFIFAFSFSAFSQSWQEMMEDPANNFYDIQSSFEEEWEGRSIEKGKGWKQFKRWEWFTEPRVFPSGDRTWMTNSYKVFKDYLEAYPPQRSLSGQWSYIGNNVVPSSGGGAGRINCIAFHPDNNNIIFAGAPAGGLWKTTTGGTYWTTNTDDLASMGISSIVIHPQNPDTMYIGTGDGDGGDTYSVGVLKSIDGGETFQPTGLNFNYMSGYTIRKLLMDPTNPDILFAASNEGIFRTDDGGDNWDQITTLSTFDMEFKPGDPQTVYACTGGRFYLSTDGGLNFTQITDGLPLSGMSRTAIAVTPANADYVYLLAGNTGNGFHGVYRSTDSGVSFELRADSPNLLGWDSDGSDSGGQAWYDLAIAASHTNANLIWTGGVNIWKSTNGGSTWGIDAHWYGGGGNPYVHADIHALEFLPGSNSTLFVGCDGGVFRTTNNGVSYSDLSGNLKISQIYEFANSPTDPYKIISGWQDNGTNLKTSQNFSRVMGGDGMDCAIDYNNDDILYGEYYYGSIYKSTDNGGDFNRIVDSDGNSGTVDEAGEWVTPFILHPVNSSTILVGKTNVYRSTNGGNTWSTVGSVAGGSGMVIGLAYCKSSPNNIFAIKRNRVFLSNDGTTFNNVTSNLSTAASFTSITFDPNNPLKAWVTYSGYNASIKVYQTSNGGVSWSNYSTGLPNLPLNCIVYQEGSNDGLYVGTDMGVFYRDSTMTSWQYFSNGLPNTIVNDMEIHYASGKIRAATYGRGIWESDLFTNEQNDAAISMVDVPNGNVCNTTYSPIITLKNAGDNDITSVKIFYSVDGAPASMVTWTGMLNASQETVVTLPAITSSLGAHTFEVYTAAPNGQTDADPSNDTLQTNFEVISGGQVVTFEITPDCFGEEISWEIENASSQIVYSVSAGTYSGNTIHPANGGVMISKEICLESGCHVFTIFDSEGNGMDGTGSGCMNSGTYAMYDQTGNLLFNDPTSDGDFGINEVHNFCVTNVYVAEFSASPTEICSGATIEFFDLSPAGTNSWNWSFPGGNPSSSTLQNPVVIYDTPGTYNVSLTAGNGTDTYSQTYSSYIIVNSSPQLSVVFDSVLCFGNCDATIDVTVTGGTTPYRFDWSNGYASEDISNACAGNYSLQLMDDKGCRDSMEVEIFTPSEILVSLVATDATCGADDGSVSASVSGGITPYILAWSNGDSIASISNLDIGAYTLTVTDGNDCVIEKTAYITNPNAPVVLADGIAESCAGECDGALQSIASGGTGTLILLWDNGMGTDDTIQNVCPGTYILSVTDDNLCEARDTVVLAAGTPYPVADFVISDDTVAIGETINFVNLSSGANQHNWSFGDGGTSSFSSTSYSYDSLGTFMVILVSCRNGCCDSDTSYVAVMDFTGISTFVQSDAVKIYPNPTDDILFVELLKGQHASVIKLYDNNGRLIEQRKSNDVKTRIDISSYSSGIYFVEVSCYDTVLRYKLVKR